MFWGAGGGFNLHNPFLDSPLVPMHKASGYGNNLKPRGIPSSLTKYQLTRNSLVFIGIDNCT